MVGKGHQPIVDEHRKAMNDVARLLDGIFAGYGFTLLVFEFEDGEGKQGRMNYISNAERDDMIIAMKEFIANHEGRTADSGAQH